MKKAYIMCRDNVCEKSVCTEYVNARECEVFKISCPKSEVEREATVLEVILLAMMGNIDIFVYSMPSILSDCESQAIDQIINIIETEIEVAMAYHCLTNFYDRKLYENKQCSLLLNLSKSDENSGENEKKQKVTGTAYVVHDDTALFEDASNRYVKMNALNVFRISCPKSEQQKIAVLKEIFKEVIKGNIDMVVFSTPDVISQNSKIILEMFKWFDVAHVKTEVCLFEMYNIYDEEAWNTELPRLMAEDKKRRLRKGR